MYDLVKEKGKHVRLDWKGEEPPCNMHDVRAAAAACSEVEVDHVVLLPFPRRQAYQSAGTGEPDQPPQAHYTCRNTGKTALGACGVARGLGSRLKRTVELTRIKFLASKNRVFVSRLSIALELAWCLLGQVQRMPLHGAR